MKLSVLWLMMTYKLEKERNEYTISTHEYISQIRTNVTISLIIRQHYYNFNRE